MKIFSSCQKAVEKKVTSYINELARYEEKAQLEHEIQCGELLRESDNLASIEAYKSWKNKKSSILPDPTVGSGT